MESVKKDERFSHIMKDPRFQRMRRKDRKVKIDKRFKGMFNDKRFKLKYTVDKRGRPIHATTNENLRKFYDLSGSEDSDDENTSDKKNKKEKASKKGKKTSGKPADVEKHGQKFDQERDEESDDNSSGEAAVEQGQESLLVTQNEAEVKNVQQTSGDDQRDDASVTTGESEAGDGSSSESEQDLDVRNGPDFARGEGDLSSSDEDEDDDTEDEKSETEEHPWGELDRDAPVAEDATHRLALCNMDWDRIKAQDLMMLLDSFKPSGGIVRSVTIYPSEYGRARMQEESVKGPIELVQPESKKSLEKDKEYQVEKLRKYQLNRLRYYYAVIECDSAVTANHIYEQCDGLEYEGSAATLDLRFIPDDMNFDDQEIKSQVCDAPNVSSYKPTLFMNSALQQSTVNLTWDETDRDRVSMTMQNFSKDDLETLDVKDYLASDSDDGRDPYGGLVQTPEYGNVSDEEDEDAQIQKYRNLLQDIQETDGKHHADQDMDMEISWEPGLKEATTSLVEKSKKKESQTPWEKYLEKRSDKQKQKRIEKEGTKSEESDQEDDISDDELPDGVDLDDPYFREELDEMAGREPKTSAKGKKKKKKSGRHVDSEENEEDKKSKAELALLMMGEEEKKHFNLKHILSEDKELKGKKKRRMRKMKKLVAEKSKDVQDDFEVDVRDPRFKDLYQNALYNIDPTAPEFKKTRAVESLISEKMRRRKQRVVETLSDATGGLDNRPTKKAKLQNELNSEQSGDKSDPSLASLVKSVKAKTKSVQYKKEQQKKQKRAV